MNMSNITERPMTTQKGIGGGMHNSFEANTGFDKGKVQDISLIRKHMVETLKE
jgi:hypothetical protein